MDEHTEARLCTYLCMTDGAVAFRQRCEYFFRHNVDIWRRIHCRHPGDNKNLDWIEDIVTHGVEDSDFTRYMQRYLIGDDDLINEDFYGHYSPHVKLLEADKEYVKGLEHDYNEHPGFWQEIKHVLSPDRVQALQSMVIQPKLRTASGRSAIDGHAGIGSTIEGRVKLKRRKDRPVAGANALPPLNIDSCCSDDNQRIEEQQAYL